MPTPPSLSPLAGQSRLTPDEADLLSTATLAEMLPGVSVAHAAPNSIFDLSCPPLEDGWLAIERYLSQTAAPNRADVVVRLLRSSSKLSERLPENKEFRTIERCTSLLDFVEVALNAEDKRIHFAAVEALADILVLADSSFRSSTLKERAEALYSSLSVEDRTLLLARVATQDPLGERKLFQRLLQSALNGPDPAMAHKLFVLVLDTYPGWGERDSKRREECLVSSLSSFLEKERLELWYEFANSTAGREIASRIPISSHFSHEFFTCVLKSPHPQELAALASNWGALLEDRLRSNNLTGAEEMLAPIHRFLEEHGLNPRELLALDYAKGTLSGAWIASAPPEQRMLNIIMCLRSIETLDKASPGAAIFLRERCGIKVFGRYPPQMLLDQLNWMELRKSAPPDEYVALFNSIKDQTHAFFRNPHIISAYEKAKAAGIPFIVSESASPRGLLKQMARRRFEFGKLSACIIGAHGNDSGITLENGQDIDSAAVSDPLVTRLLDELFADNAQVVFQSCDVGYPNGFVSTLISNHSGRGVTIYCTDEAVALSSIVLIKEGGNSLLLSGTFGENGRSTVVALSDQRLSALYTAQPRLASDDSLQELRGEDLAIAAPKDAILAFNKRQLRNLSRQRALPREFHDRILFAPGLYSQGTEPWSQGASSNSLPRQNARALLNWMASAYLRSGAGDGLEATIH